MQNITIDANETATITIDMPDGKKLVVDIVGDADDNEYWRDVYISRVLPSGNTQDVCCAELNRNNDDTNIFVWADEYRDDYTNEFHIKPVEEDANEVQ